MLQPCLGIVGQIIFSSSLSNASRSRPRVASMARFTVRYTISRIPTNTRSYNNLLEARCTGHVLVEHGCGTEIGWIEAPPFTEELKYAETLLPEGVITICRDPRRVCATALYGG